MPILRYTELIELIYLTSIMKEERVKSQKISTDDLLEYYWNNEPIYHPEVVKPMAPNSVKKNRILSFVLLILYISFTVYLLQISTNPHIISWIFGLICGAFVADFISGCAHIFIDFMPSTKKTSLHKQLFLSRVHHHELFRPARLNISSLWFSPALYALFLIVILPVLVIKFVFSYSIPDWIVPYPRLDCSILAVSFMAYIYFTDNSRGCSRERIKFKIEKKPQILTKIQYHYLCQKTFHASSKDRPGLLCTKWLG